MLTENERLFVEFWEKNRLREKNWKYQLLTGLPIGLLFSVPILALLLSAKLWFKGADVLATTMVNPFVLFIAVFIIAVFIAVFHKNHRWDIREQQYRSLKAREEQEKANRQVS